jgi:hypothetical protein
VRQGLRPRRHVRRAGAVEAITTHGDCPFEPPKPIQIVEGKQDARWLHGRLVFRSGPANQARNYPRGCANKMSSRHESHALASTSGRSDGGASHTVGSRGENGSPRGPKPGRCDGW